MVEYMCGIYTCGTEKTFPSSFSSSSEANASELLENLEEMFAFNINEEKF